MKAVVQRVASARVEIEGATVGEIDRGLLVLLGVARGDAESDAAWMAEKIPSLRIVEDAEGKMNLGLEEVGGALLAVSQFTLLGDARKGRRPSFVRAAPPDDANRLYERFVELARSRGLTVRTGRFQAHMQVHLVNDGPVTILLESPGSEGRA
jgi:D-tyrosyl-tRNA(Tyr) deacylase